jgi:hypothetical protein
MDLSKQILGDAENVQVEKKYLQPTKTWFMERGDGKIFACEEIEAWELLRNKSNWRRNDFKIIGVSDGLIYAQAVNEASNLIDKQQIQNRLRRGFEEELEKARGNIEFPTNQNVTTPGIVGDKRKKIISQLT